MTIAESAALYSEVLKSVTPEEKIDRALAELDAAKTKLRRMPIKELVSLVQRSLDDMIAVAKDWELAGCEAKGMVPGTELGCEEIQTGPLATARYLRLLMQSLKDIESEGTPRLPGEIVTGPDGHLRVQVVPTKGLFDSIAFQGFKAHVWQQHGVTAGNLKQNMAEYFREGRKTEGVAVVLGAGNVSSIAPIDAFGKIFQEGKVVLLKMNPVNEYLGPIFEKAFKAIIDAGFLRVVYGGAEVGSHALQHRLVDEAHITGSILSHETIVWGPPGPDRDRRKANNDPVLRKTITSELGNVSPWIVAPGKYSEAQLWFQAQNLASSVANNASFNCVATKVVVTWKGWNQRKQFLDLVEKALAEIPARKAYYPGAVDRWKKFTGDSPSSCPTGTLPWRIIRDVDSRSESIHFVEENFVCVFVETAIEAKDEIDFLARATDFVNQQLRGTLGCSIMVHPSLRKSAEGESAFQRTLANLEYGSIGVNYWSALCYAMMSPPWGGYPGADLHDPVSGIGVVHNTYMFDKPLKTVISGPLTQPLKPLWFAGNKTAPKVSQKVVDLYHRPSPLKIPGLLLAALGF
jgi:hypothetical protein